jgi:outer membrane protein assembly factor BamB
MTPRTSTRAVQRLLRSSIAILLLAGACFGKTTISLSTAIGPPTTKFQVSGSGFAHSVKVDIYFDSADKAVVTTNSSGAFSKVTISVPTMAQPGNHTVKATEHSGGTASATATFLVRTDWAQFHRTNMQRWNQYENTLNVNNVGRLKLKWSTSVSSSTDSPAVYSGVVYVTGGNRQLGNLYALNPATGAQNWEYSVYAGFSSSPAVAGGTVYVGNIAESGPLNDLYAVNATTGTFAWACCGMGQAVDSAPTVVNGVVYFIDDGIGLVYAVDAGSGSIKWTFQTTGKASSISSPAVINNMLYVGSNDQNLYALNATTGAMEWSFPTGGPIQAAPAVANGVVYFGSDNLYALDATTGAVKWIAPLGVASSAAIANGTLYLGAYDGNLYALNATTGATLWSYNTGGQVQSSPAVANGVVYFGSDQLYALNASTGAKLWSYNITRPASPVVADGRVYVTDWGTGYVYCFGLN